MTLYSTVGASGASTPLRIFVAYAAGAAAAEVAGLAGGAFAATIGYGALLLVLAAHAAMSVVKTGPLATVPAAAPFIAVGVPAMLRFSTLTLEGSPSAVVRHYGVVGIPAFLALTTAWVSFPELRPRRVPQVDRTTVFIAAWGLPVGLLFAPAFTRASLVPEHGRWRSVVLVVVILVAAAIIEELLFRGVVQTSLREFVGPYAPLVGTAALIPAYLNVRPVGFVFVALFTGCATALAVELVGAIRGVILARIVFLVGLVVFWPRVLGLP